MNGGILGWLNSDCPNCKYSRKTLEALPMPVFVVDPEGTFLFINDSCLKMIGSPDRDHSMQYNFFSLPTVKAAGIDVVLRESLTGKMIETEFSYLSMWGRKATGQLMCFPIRGPEAETIAVAGIATLQSESSQGPPPEGLSRDEISDALETTRIEMQKLDRLRKRFVAVVSHELRTPLVPLLGYLEMLQGDKLGSLNSDQRKAVDVAMRSAQRLIDHVEKVLTVASDQRSFVSRSGATVAVRPLFEEVLESMQPEADRKNLHVELLCANDIPDVSGDKDCLTRVFMTLLDNAIKFATEETHIQLRGERSDGNIILDVANVGKTIPASERKWIFDPFYQVESPSVRQHGGLGLGLSIARETVRAYGGQISVVDDDHFDTVIRVQLPPAAETKDIGFRVLLADPSTRRRKRIIDLLAHRQVEIREMEDSENVTKLLETWRPTVLVMAIDDESNLDVLRVIRSEGAGRFLPVFAITELPDTTLRRQALDAGATAILPSPIDEDWLVRLIEAVYPVHI